MKEVVCPECHKLVRTSKDSCPNCGYPFKNIKMVQPNKTINEVPLQQIKKVYVKEAPTFELREDEKDATIIQRDGQYYLVIRTYNTSNIQSFSNIYIEKIN